MPDRDYLAPDGLPGYHSRHDGGWDDELDIWTHCPAHRGVLNDLRHRSVPAEIVAFLEALRTDLTPAIAVEASAW
jgi:hypothetical protein